MISKISKLLINNFNMVKHIYLKTFIGENISNKDLVLKILSGLIIKTKIIHILISF